MRWRTTMPVSALAIAVALGLAGCGAAAPESGASGAPTASGPVLPLAELDVPAETYANFVRENARRVFTRVAR